MKQIRTIFILLVAFCISMPLFAQEDNGLEETLSNMSSDAAKVYVAPAISAFGSNLNSGWITGAPKPVKFGLTVNLRIVAMGSFFSDEDKNFESQGFFHYNEDQVIEIMAASNINSSHPQYEDIKNALLSQEWEVRMSGPTIVGAKDEYLEVEFPGATIQGQYIGQYAVSIEEINGYLEDLSILPTASAQLNLGTVFGTNLSIRYFPEMDIEDLGKFNYFGIGFIHNPAVWFDHPLPVDVSVGFFTQSLSVGDIFESTANQYGLYFSKQFGMGISVTPYIGFTIETSETTVSYDYEYETPAGIITSRINFDLEGDNSFGTTIGANFNLMVVNLNVDYKMASMNTLSAGISFGIN